MLGKAGLVSRTLCASHIGFEASLLTSVEDPCLGSLWCPVTGDIPWSPAATRSGSLPLAWSMKSASLESPNTLCTWRCCFIGVSGSGAVSGPRNRVVDLLAFKRAS